MKYNFREITSKDLFFVKQDNKKTMFEGNKIVKFKPSIILLTTLSIVGSYFAYK